MEKIQNGVDVVAAVIFMAEIFVWEFVFGVLALNGADSVKPIGDQY